MPLRNRSQYVQGLRDGREVYLRGQRVADVTDHPFFKPVIDHVSLDFELQLDPKYSQLFTFTEEGRTFSRYFKIPRSADDLLDRSRMIGTSTRFGGSSHLILKQIGTDCLFALEIVTRTLNRRNGAEYNERVKNFQRHCMENDLTMAVAQTDVKGHRMREPTDQDHPDYYLRIVKQTDDGILVRGAKAHTTSAPVADELIVIPTRTMSKTNRDYAVAFAIPVNSKGLKMITSPFSHTTSSRFHHPISSRHHEVETLTIFDDVFVPKERVFLQGQWEFAGPVALTFAQFHRFTAISYKAPLLDLLVGLAHLVAEYNGISEASHVRDKIAKLTCYSQIVQALARASGRECRMVEGVAVPNPIISNAAKLYFASNYHEQVSYLQDLAGGLVATGPSEEDLSSELTGPYVTKYLGAGEHASAENRLRIMNLIRDLTASDFGGYNEILQIHGEGSPEAEKIAIFREFDASLCIEYAKKLAGIERINSTV